MKIAEQVTIICIAYNHEEWIEETLESVRLQDYYAKDLIIVDNGSTDETPEIIRRWINQSSGKLSVKTVFKEKEESYCKLFNDQLLGVKSQYVIDLSGDDVLYPDHLTLSISKLKKAPKAAFSFCDAYIMEPSQLVHTFYKRSIAGDLEEEIEVGELFEKLISRNFICSPTIVFNAPILIKEGGYDESLYYEDFDIQLRLARKYSLIFSDHVGLLKRKHSLSMSSGQYIRYHSQMLPSTLKVCQKVQHLITTDSEKKALGTRILYELKHALWSANFETAEGFVKLGNEMGLKGLKFLYYKCWLKLRLDFSWLYVRIT